MEAMSDVLAALTDPGRDPAPAGGQEVGPRDTSVGELAPDPDRAAQLQRRDQLQRKTELP